MPTRADWEQDTQSFERDWWGDCANTYGEETKQIAYSRVMGLYEHDWRGGDHWPTYDFNAQRVLDVGGGPSSMLLKASFDEAWVIDPCPYPDWVTQRYSEHGVFYRREPAEDALPTIDDDYFDTALMYNVLQHTIDPATIVRELARVARAVHLFEWVDQEPHDGHPHMLRAEDIADWLGVGTQHVAGTGKHVWLDEQYHSITSASRSSVRQHGWGGSFLVG